MSAHQPTDAVLEAWPLRTGPNNSTAHHGEHAAWFECDWSAMATPGYILERCCRRLDPAVMRSVDGKLPQSNRSYSEGVSFMSPLLEDKVALVTGAGHGIGRGHALELAKHGATVIVNDLGTSVHGEGSGRDAERVVEIITERGGFAIADFGDVSNEDQAGAMVQRAIDELGRIDILVNNA